MPDTQIIDVFDKSVWGEDERRYFGIIDQACKEKKDALLSNGRPEHAVYLIHKFLENAQQHVRLLTGQLSRTLDGVEVYKNPHIIKAALTFLAKEDTALSVISENDIDVPGPSQDHPFIQEVTSAKERGDIQGSLKVYRESEEHKTILREANFSYHWMVMDEQAYRLEKDKDKATAFVNFGDKDRATRLANLFDSIAVRSRVLCEV